MDTASNLLDRLARRNQLETWSLGRRRLGELWFFQEGGDYGFGYVIAPISTPEAFISHLWSYRFPLIRCSCRSVPVFRFRLGM